MRVHAEKSQNLRRGDSTAQRLADGVAGDEGHRKVGESREIRKLKQWNADSQISIFRSISNLR